MSDKAPSYSSQVCPGCLQSFVCKAQDIAGCQCKGICLNKEQQAFINQQFTTCLCINCLQTLQQEYESQAGSSVR